METQPSQRLSRPQGEDPPTSGLAVAVRAGSRRALAKAITLAESARSDHAQAAQALLSELMPFTGKSLRVGLTGVPGVGKSTFVESLGLRLVEAGHRVAVLAVDPSSGRTGGSIMGDKTRMTRLSVDPRAFIRPSPSAGTLGGVTRRTREAMLLCEAAGYDVILVETVGVGQSEFAVASMTDLFVLLALPGAGDELQGVKRGIMELADLVVVNKADVNAAAANRAQSDLQSALRLLSHSPRWTPRVLQASALSGEGVHEVWESVLAYREVLGASGIGEKREAQTAAWFDELLREEVWQSFVERTGPATVRQARAQVTAGDLTPLQAVRDLLARVDSERERQNDLPADH